VVPGRRLTISEREDIAHWLAKGHDMHAIASRIRASPSAVSRELRRNAVPIGLMSRVPRAY